MPGRQSLEMNFTSAAFTMDMFEAANAVTGVDEKAIISEAKKYDVVGGTVVLPYKVEAESIYINGLNKGETAGEGIFSVEIDEDMPSATITFSETDVKDGDQIEVFFDREVEGVHTLNMTTTNPSARGSLTARWPVYAGSDNGAESAIKGYVEVFVPLCRVSALPGFSTSYKSASTFALGFSAMDAGRSDGLWYTIRYIPA